MNKETKKASREYVKNKDLYAEILKSKEDDKLTDKAVSMLVLICENIIRKMVYQDPEDRKDCLQGAIVDCLMYWRSFNPEKSNNPFSYFSSIACNGLAKTWRKLGKLNFPNSIMTRLSNENLHSL